MAELTIQAGADSLKLTRDMRLGLVVATLKCHAPDMETALFGAAPSIGVNVPEWNPRAVTRRPGGDVEGFDVVLSFEGHPEPDKADEETFELEGSTSENPIESHWNYEALLSHYKGKEDANGRAKWPAKFTDTKGQKGRNPMHGVDAWPSPGLIWNHNFVKSRLPEGLVQELGTLSTSVPGNPPQLAGNRDWLNIRVRAKQRGNIWQIQRSWQLSDPGGSVPEMYQLVR